jgi:parallel beta-helix repeat protein
MDKIKLFFFLSFTLIVSVHTLHAFYIDDHDNQLGSNSAAIESAWANAGYAGGVENLIDPDPAYIYDISALPDSLKAIPWYCIDAIPNSPDTSINTTAFRQLLKALNNPDDPYLSHSIKILSIPPGIYNISDSLKLPSNIIIRGDGSEQTILNFIVPENPTMTNSNCLNAFEMIGINNTGIEDLTIKRFCLPNGDHDLHQNLLDNGGMNNSNNIYIEGSKNCWVTGVESVRPLRHHVELEADSLITVSGCYFNSVRIRSGGGFGYGIQFINGTYQCLIENNIFRHNRHGVIFNDGAHYNVVAYNYIRDSECVYEFCSDDNDLSSTIYVRHYAYGDINLHGQNDESGQAPDSYVGPYANLIEGNNCNSITVDSAHKQNGQKNVLLRNKVLNDGIHIWGYNGFPDWLPGDLIATCIVDIPSLQFLDLGLRYLTDSNDNSHILIGVQK